MSPTHDPALPTIIVIAAAISAFMWTGGAAIAVTLVWRRARRIQATDPTAASAPADPQAVLFYVLSLLFWPAALACSVLFLRTPAKARMGGICATLGMAQVLAIAWLVSIAFIVFREEIARLLPL